MEGAFLVSADLVDGEISGVELLSGQGRALVLKNPWPGHQVAFTAKGKKAVVTEGELLRFETKKGSYYRIEKR